MKFFILIAMFTLLSFNNRASILVVINTNDSGPGSLREAVTNAVEGDEVRFSPTLISGGNATILLTSEIYVLTAIKIVGLYNANDTLYISGQTTSRIFNVDPSFSTTRKFELDSVVLVYGNGSITGDTGGAIFLIGTDSLLVSHSRFSYNTADFGGAIGYGYIGGASIVAVFDGCELSYNDAVNAGGAIMAENGSNLPEKTLISLNNCSILYNHSYYGAGVFCSSASNSLSNIATVISSNCLFMGNNANMGAAIHCSTASEESFTNVIISNSNFSENTSIEFGGVMRAVSIGGNVSVAAENSTFNNNTAGYGGGIYAAADGIGNVEVVLTNSTMFGNANGNGGAIYAGSDDTTEVKIYNSTIVNNSGTAGGGVYIQGGVYSEIKVKSSIVGSNSGGNFYSPFAMPISSLGYNIFSDVTLLGSVSSDQLGATAGQLQLGLLQLNGGTTLTMLPASGSIAIDNGNPLDLTDAQNRAICGTRDVGAAENCVSSTGITTTIRTNEFSVAPNPATDEVRLSFEGDIAYLKITDVMGKLIEEKIIYKNEKIDFRNYSFGVYFFTVEVNKQKSVCKVVKQ